MLADAAWSDRLLHEGRYAVGFWKHCCGQGKLAWESVYIYGEYLMFCIVIIFRYNWKSFLLIAGDCVNELVKWLRVGTYVYGQWACIFPNTEGSNVCR